MPYAVAATVAVGLFAETFTCALAIPRLKAAEAVIAGLPLSVTATVMGKIPPAAGVPDSIPPVDKAMVAGSVPVESANLYGAVPPLAWRLAL